MSQRHFICSKSKTSVASFASRIYFPPCKSAALLGWRNWYTRKTKDLVPKGLRVRVPSRAPLFVNLRCMAAQPNGQWDKVLGADPTAKEFSSCQLSAFLFSVCKADEKL